MARHFIHGKCKKLRILFLTFLRVSGRTFFCTKSIKRLKFVSILVESSFKIKAERKEDIFQQLRTSNDARSLSLLVDRIRRDSLLKTGFSLSLLEAYQQHNIQPSSAVCGERKNLFCSCATGQLLFLYRLKESKVIWKCSWCGKVFTLTFKHDHDHRRRKYMHRNHMGRNESEITTAETIKKERKDWDSFLG